MSKLIIYYFQFLINYFFSINKYNKSYSLNGEDLIIADYFANKKKFNGKYLDIGAFHSSWLSLTFQLHKIGWSGYVVEPDKSKCLSFLILRNKKCKVINKALSTKNEGLKFYKFKRKFIFSEIDTGSLKFRKRFKEKDVYTQKVQGITINKLLREVGDVDFLKLSTEGTEELFLKQIIKLKKLPKMICFRKNLRTNYKIYEKKFSIINYKILFNTTAFMCYVKNDEKKS